MEKTAYEAGFELGIEKSARRRVVRQLIGVGEKVKEMSPRAKRALKKVEKLSPRAQRAGKTTKSMRDNASIRQQVRNLIGYPVRPTLSVKDVLEQRAAAKKIRKQLAFGNLGGYRKMVKNNIGAAMKKSHPISQSIAAEVKKPGFNYGRALRYGGAGLGSAAIGAGIGYGTDR